MSNSFLATQIGYQPTGVNGTPKTSTLFFGRTVSGSNSYDGPGLGAGGRPDYLQNLVINIARGPQSTNQWGTVTLNVEDLVKIARNNSEFPDNLNLTFKEIAVCEDGVEKSIVVLASQTF